MASLFTHPAVPLALATAVGSDAVPRRLTLLGIVCSVLPDADVVGFRFGVSYGHLFGHRGFSHSIAFAVLVAVVAAASAGRLGVRRRVAFAFVLLATASHGFLDALTNGGLGIAFFSPFSNARYFLPWEVLQVSPIGIEHFFTPWGWQVILSELRWVWTPALAVALAGVTVRRLGRRPAPAPVTERERDG